MRSILSPIGGPLAALAALLWLGGCEPRPIGWMSYEGEQYSLTAENFRLIRQRMIVDELKPRLGGKWRAEAAIAELPKFDQDRSEFEWDRASVTVSLIGDGSAAVPLPSHEVQGVAYEKLKKVVWRPSANITVKVLEISDAARFAAAPAPTAAPAPLAVVAKPAGAPSSYVVEPGDTLMQISAAAYGSAKHWRRILEANPGLDPGAMPVGKAIVLPVLTDAPPAPAAKPAPGGS